MHYLQNVQYETMRMYGTVTQLLERHVENDMLLLGTTTSPSSSGGNTGSSTGSGSINRGGLFAFLSINVAVLCDSVLCTYHKKAPVIVCSAHYNTRCSCTAPKVGLTLYDFLVAD